MLTPAAMDLNLVWCTNVTSILSWQYHKNYYANPEGHGIMAMFSGR